MNLHDYTHIVINTSGGKDSQTMLGHVVDLARQQCFLGPIYVVHADLGRVEWPGSKELAGLQAQHYGLPLHVVKREQGDLLQQIEQRGKFPSNSCRYCTSDHKRGPIEKFIRHSPEIPGRRMRVLNCMGMRAQESPARAKKPVLEMNARQTNGKREVWNWLPIHHWTLDDVWNDIRRRRVPHHFAYDLGMPRLSCVFCIFSPWDALLLGGKHNRSLLDEYVRIEQQIKHTLRKDCTLQSVQAALDAGVQPGNISDWRM